MQTILLECYQFAKEFMKSKFIVVFINSTPQIYSFKRRTHSNSKDKYFLKIIINPQKILLQSPEENILKLQKSKKESQENIVTISDKLQRYPRKVQNSFPNISFQKLL